MSMEADVRREKGGLVMTASIGAAGRGALGAGTGGGYDVRWNATEKRIEKSADGVNWTPVLEFAEYDA